MTEKLRDTHYSRQLQKHDMFYNYMTYINISSLYKQIL
jgi:hypothetical protein